MRHIRLFAFTFFLFFTNYLSSQTVPLNIQQVAHVPTSSLIVPSELNDKLNFLSKRLSLTSDTIGMKKGMWLAFLFHTLGIVTTLVAVDLDSLFLATLLMGLGNGMVEAVCNPMVASMYPDQKTKMLNRFHLWWPAGIVVGSIAGFIIMDLM